MSFRPLRMILLLATIALVLVAGGCGGGDDESSGGAGGQLVFAGASDPVVIDGALVSDGESIRVIYADLQKTLINLKPGTTELEPGLASVEVSPDALGTGYTFSLREGVTFHDGTDVQRRGRLLQLRPLVQLQGPAPEREREDYY